MDDMKMDMYWKVNGDCTYFYDFNERKVQKYNRDTWERMHEKYGGSGSVGDMCYGYLNKTFNLVHLSEWDRNMIKWAPGVIINGRPYRAILSIIASLQI